MLVLREKGSPVDVVSIEDYLGASDYGQLGGDELFERLTDSVPIGVNAAYYANIVRERSITRKLIEAHRAGIIDATSTEFDAYQLLTKSGLAIAAIAEKEVAGQAVCARDLIAETMAELARIKDGEFVGLSSGFPDLDRVVGGFQGGQLVVIAARPSIGKTALALGIAARCCEDGRHALFVSLEMNRGEICRRLLAMYSGVSSGKITNPKYQNENDHRGILMAADAISHMGLTVDDTPSRTISQIAACARRQKSRGGLDLLVIDQLSFIDSGASVKGENRQEVVARISSGLKSMARQLGVAVIICHQLNRQVESRPDKRPMLSDLRESGQIEADADVALLIHRPEFYQEGDRVGEADIHVAKNRNGPTGPVLMAFQKETMKFDSISRSDAAY
jgi:replicative DNA helicase